MSFRLKLVLSYLLLLLGGLVIGITAWLQFEQLKSSVDNLLLWIQPRMEATDELEINLIGTGFGLLGYLHDHDPKHLQRIKKDKVDFSRFLDHYRRLASNTQERRFAEQLQHAFARFSALTTKLIEGKDQQVQQFAQLEQNLNIIDHLLDNNIQSSITDNIPDASKKKAISYEFEININGMMKWLARYLETHDADDIVGFRQDQRELVSYVRDYYALSLSRHEKQQIKRFEQDFKRISLLGDNQIKLEILQQQRLGRLVQLRRDIDDLLDDKVQLQAYQSMQQASGETLDHASHASVLIFTILIVTMVAGIILILLLRRSFNNAINNLLDASDAMAAGDYDKPITAVSDNEFGNLANSFNRMAHAVQCRQQELETVIHSIVDAVITIDEQGRVNRFNQSAEQIFGYTSKELMGKNISILMPEPHHSRHDAYLRNYLDGGEAGFIGLGGREVEGKRKDGSLFPMELSISETEFSGQRVFIGTVRDITEQKQAAALILDTTERLERQHTVYASLSHLLGTRGLALADAVQMITEDTAQAMKVGIVGVWQLSEDGKKLCCLDRYDADTQTHSCDESTLIRDDYPVYFDALEQQRIIDAGDVSTDHRIAEFADTSMLPTGTHALLDVAVRHEGRLIGVLRLLYMGAKRHWHADEQQFGQAIASLITLLFEIDHRQQIEQKIIEQNIELHRASRMKSEFLANMSHELRTPLNAIIGFSEVMQDGLAGEMNAEQLEYTGDIHASGQHLLMLINDILDLSKIEAGKMELHCTEVALREMAQACLAIVREKASSHGISLKLSLDNAPEVAVFDERKCKQMLFNLLSNAVKFSDRGGEVKLIMRCVKCDAVSVDVTADADTWLEISVQDQGVGIRQEDIKKLFQSFQQLENPLTKSHEGTGLGLALVKRMSELHGGGVGVSSNFGEGSRFTIWLPMLPQDKPSKITLPVVVGKGGLNHIGAVLNASAPSILVIEDDVKTASLLLLQLEQAGYRCDCVHSAEDALQWLQRQQPDIITLDILLPGMDGWQFLEQIRKDERYCDIPVVIVSIVAEEEHGYALGASQVLSKPVSKESLLHSIALLGFGETGQHLSVMIVDDDAKALRLMERYLQAEGFTVIKAQGGKEAISMAAEVKPNLLLLDLMMPDVSGFDVVEALKSQPQTASIPIIILTAKEITKADRARLNHHIVKIMRKQSLEQVRFLDEINRVNKQRFIHNRGVRASIPDIDEHAYILVVEDNLATAKVMQVMLQSHGYEVGYAGNGKIAMEMMQQRRPDLLLLDLIMPEMDGFTLIERMQTMPQLHDLPLLIVSCHQDMPDKIACFSANAFLSKPFNHDELVNAIGRLISNDRSTPSLLVIDDDPQVIKLVASFVKNSNYQLQSASGGNDGLNIARQHQPDLILLDIMMPDLSGFEVIDRLKSDAVTRDIPVIIMTSKQLNEKEMDYLSHLSEQIVSKSDLHPRTFIAEVARLTEPGKGEA